MLFAIDLTAKLGSMDPDSGWDVAEFFGSGRRSWGATARGPLGKPVRPRFAREPDPMIFRALSAHALRVIPSGPIGTRPPRGTTPDRLRCSPHAVSRASSRPMSRSPTRLERSTARSPPAGSEWIRWSSSRIDASPTGLMPATPQKVSASLTCMSPPCSSHRSDRPNRRRRAEGRPRRKDLGSSPPTIPARTAVARSERAASASGLKPPPADASSRNSLRSLGGHPYWPTSAARLRLASGRRDLVSSAACPAALSPR